MLEKAAATAFLEATVVHETADDLSFKRRMAPIYDAINQLQSPNFFLNVEVLQVGTATAPRSAPMSPVSAATPATTPSSRGSQRIGSIPAGV